MKSNTRNTRKKRIHRNKTRKHRHKKSYKYGGYAYTTDVTTTPRNKHGIKKIKN